MDSEYIISSYVQDGMLFELVVLKFETEVVQNGSIGAITVSPRVRITKVVEPGAADKG